MKERIALDEFNQLPEWAQGAFKLDESQGDYVFGYVPKGRLDEFRANNTKLLKDRDQMLEKLNRFESDAAPQSETGAPQAQKNFEAKGLEGLQRRYRQLEQQAQAEKSQLLTQLKELKVRQELVLAINQVGGYQEGALDLMVEQGTKVFQLDDQGEVRPVGANGETLYEGAEPLKMTDWVGQLSVKQPFLFKHSTGGGARGSGIQNSPKGALNPSQYDGNVVPKETLEKLAAGS